ncbi:serine/threonine-protein kinase ripk4, putative [Cordyceps militaris CM01]|uniref:Serine/threonine-protein kinase ripk4, putative n=1 Tax=Cordyceps militaris (strain CM01) TaxID=983644 RepID=G3JTS4_CORMM|nr:serine/threonine-protein kinase ripk4, putative [Cordyceps militaris CM01]EGX88078.1 serine/threonine-protein kinase ripk4, putative [Cordyceps militaris CM01]
MPQKDPPQTKTHDAYTVGWICALTNEQTAATVLLDERHGDLPSPTTDSNAYTLGRVGNHNVVIACLPQGVTGTNAAAGVATSMVQTYPKVKFGLMVGIGGGIPPKVRLGDVVVSTPVGNYPGVVQWDLGKALSGGEFKQTGVLNRPPDILLTALSKLQTQNDMYGSEISNYLTAIKDYPKLARFTWSKRLKDPLSEGGRDFSTSPDEKMGNTGPAEEKAQRSEEDMCVHFGLIGSGNQVIKDAKLRDRLNERYEGELLCVEMEAAGLMNKFPCLVIRGISDYANEEKNDDWRDYAAARAAGFAKELLSFVQPAEVDRASAAKDVAGIIIEQVGKVQVSVSHIEDDLAYSRKRSCQQDTKEILDWFTPVNYGPTQSDYLSRRQYGTGSWFLDSEKFQAWVNTDKTTLFCPGIPGAGKTMFTSIVIDYLEKRFGLTPKVGIAYIYCNHNRQHDQEFPILLLSLLKQLAAHLPSLPKCMEDLYHTKKNTSTRPSLDEISTAFVAILGLYSRVFVLFDALDESPDRSWSTLLKGLFHHQKNYNINIFATSRNIPDINEHFKAAMSSEILEIRANDKDVVKYLHGHMDELPSLVKDNKDLRTEIIEQIANAADGMLVHTRDTISQLLTLCRFLLAVLMIRSIADKMTMNQLRAASRRDKQGGQSILSIVYKATMDRINTQMPGKRELARNVLLWLSCAKRQLSPKALQDALATRPGMTRTTSVGDRPTVADMVSVCAGLVTVDERSQVIRLAHSTTQEYFEETREHWFTKPDQSILEICITTMSSNSSPGYPVARPELNSLSTYAHYFWMSHLQKDLEATHTVIHFFKSEDIFKKACQTAFSIRSKQAIPNSKLLGLIMAAMFGLAKITKVLIDSYIETPLLCVYAADHGHADTVEQILGATATLHASSGATRRYCVEKAMTAGRDLDTTYRLHAVPALISAAANGHLEIVSMLLEAGVNAKAAIVGFISHLARDLAALRYHAEIIRRLIEAGADVNDSYGEGITALLAAAEGGHLEALEILLAEGADVTTGKSRQHGTAFQAAVERGKFDIRSILLAAGADVNAPGSRRLRATALQMAANRGHVEAMAMLLEAGADVNAAAVPRVASTLHAAAITGCLALAEKMRAAGATNPDSPREMGRMLGDACLRGPFDLVHNLLASIPEQNLSICLEEANKYCWEYHDPTESASYLLLLLEQVLASPFAADKFSVHRLAVAYFKLDFAKKLPPTGLT